MKFLSRIHTTYPYRYPATLNRVIDGDTIVVNVNLSDKVIIEEVKLRFLAISAPESRGPEKAKGKLATERITSFITNRQLIVQKFSEDSFGRWVSVLWADGIDVIEWLRDEGLVKYWNYGKMPRPNFPEGEAYPLEIEPNA